MALEATGWSLRIQTFSKAESANGMDACRAVGAAASATGEVGSEEGSIVRPRTATSDILAKRELDGAGSFVIFMVILFPEIAFG